MRRALILIALLLTAAPISAARAATAKPPKLGAALKTCTTSALPVQRIAASGSAEVGRPAPGEQRAVPVTAVACLPLTTIVVRVDADRRVEESQERGNGARRQCPLTLR